MDARAGGGENRAKRSSPAAPLETTTMETTTREEARKHFRAIKLACFAIERMADEYMHFTEVFDLMRDGDKTGTSGKIADDFLGTLKEAGEIVNRAAQLLGDSIEEPSPESCEDTEQAFDVLNEMYGSLYSSVPE
jgi:hypothetical protein